MYRLIEGDGMEISMDKMTKKIIGAFVVILVIAAAILFAFFQQNKSAREDAEKEVLPTTEVGKLLAKDLDTKYPETPTEVLKLYWRINACMYSAETSKEDAKKLLEQLCNLYDKEFLKEDKNSVDAMFENFLKEKESRLDAEQKISSYIVQKNDTIEVKVVDDKSCATVTTATLIGVKGDKSQVVYEDFLCRKDSENKWKILGWQQVSSEEAADSGVSVNIK